MALSTIYVHDPDSNSNKPILCFSENSFGSTPASVNIHHVIGFPVTKSITIAQSAISALSTEHDCGSSESLINGVIAAYVDNAAPPEYIDFFFKIRDDYSAMKNMVFSIGRATLLDTPFNDSTNRVYTALQFSLPHFECVGMNVAPFASIGAKLPAAWAPATSLVIEVDILGLPNVLAP